MGIARSIGSDVSGLIYTILQFSLKKFIHEYLIQFLIEKITVQSQRTRGDCVKAVIKMKNTSVIILRNLYENEKREASELANGFLSHFFPFSLSSLN